MTNAKRQPAASVSGPLQWSEIGAGLLLTAAVIYLQVTAWLSAGPLWRDEATSVNVVNLPSLWTMWVDGGRWDSFPALWHTLLRGWSAVGLGSSDLALRASGLAVGVGTLAALWWAVRQLGGKAPLVSLLLLGLSPVFLVSGGSVRAYGLGVLTLLLAAAAIWRMVNQPSWGRVVFAACASLLCVHSVFPNCIMLLALCLGATAVAVRRRHWRAAITVLAGGALAGASMLVYLQSAAQRKEWDVIMQYPVNLPYFTAAFLETVSESASWMIWVWLALLVLVTLSGVYLAFRPARPVTPDLRELPLFAFVILVTGTACFAAYLDLLKYAVTARYFLPLIGLGALCLDAGLVPLMRSSAVTRQVLPVAIALLAAGSFPSALAAAHTRMTNVDEAARQVERSAGPGDLMVVDPWFLGVTVQRYYHGAAPWVTLPDFEQRMFQPAPDFKARMAEVRPLVPVLRRVQGVLESGHRLWLLGNTRFLAPGQSPMCLPPAPQSPYGWRMSAYTADWSCQLGDLLQRHARSITLIPIPDLPFVNVDEKVRLVVVDGWQQPAYGAGAEGQSSP